MYSYFHDQSGRIIGKCWGPNPTEAQRMTDAGYLVLESDRDVDISTHVIVGGVLEPLPLPGLADLKRQTARAWKQTIQQFIRKKPDGNTRYDHDLMLNLLSFATAKRLQGLSPAPVDGVESWVAAVQADYAARLQEIRAAADQSALDALDLSYERLEGLFGVAGSQLPDPDIYTTDLLTQG